MGHSQAEKAQSRERILAEASAELRENGLESLSVGRLMQSVNLTHGGFYGHFESRSELIKAALKRALVDGAAASRATSGSDRPRSITAIAKSYLSRTHRDNPKSGCAIAALVSDVARADIETRAIMEEHIEQFISGITQTIDDDSDDTALVAVSALVGGLILSRVITRTSRSDAVLRVVRDHVVAIADE